MNQLILAVTGGPGAPERGRLADDPRHRRRRLPHPRQRRDRRDEVPDPRHTNSGSSRTARAPAATEARRARTWNTAPSAMQPSRSSTCRDGTYNPSRGVRGGLDGGAAQQRKRFRDGTVSDELGSYAQSRAAARGDDHLGLMRRRRLRAARRARPRASRERRQRGMDHAGSRTRHLSRRDHRRRRPSIGKQQKRLPNVIAAVPVSTPRPPARASRRDRRRSSVPPGEGRAPYRTATHRLEPTPSHRRSTTAAFAAGTASQSSPRTASSSWSCGSAASRSARSSSRSTQRSKAAQLAHILRDSEPKVVLSGHRPSTQARRARPTRIRSHRMDDRHSLRARLARAFRWPRSPLGDASFGATPSPAVDHPAAILYTSGTTGPSKGVVCPHSQLYWWGLNTAARSASTRDDVLYTCLPLFHMNALNTIVQGLISGARVVIGPRFSASRFWRRVIEADANVTYLLGAMVSILVAQPAGELDRAHRVRIVLGPGNPCASCGRLSRSGSAYASSKVTA